MSWLRRWAPPGRDLVLAAVFIAVYIASSRFLVRHGWYPHSLIEWDIAAGFSAGTLVSRHRFPRTTLLVVALVYPLCYSTFADVKVLLNESHVLPILLAAYTVAASGQVRALVTLVIAGIGITDICVPPVTWLGWILHPEVLREEFWGWNFSQLVLAQAAVLAVVLLGRAAYRQQRSTAQLLARHQEIERLRRVETDQMVMAERTRIARELHDVVAHHISAMVIRAQAADRVAADRPEETRAAVRWIAASGQETLAAMRHVVRVLRSSETGSSLTPQATLAELPHMAERLRAVGLAVELHVPAVPPVLPSAVELAAVRIVQEGLTNVLVHAKATRAVVQVRLEHDQLLLDIHDDGTAGSPPTQPIAVISARPRGPREPSAAQLRAAGKSLGGNGLIGMRERAASCGGWLAVRTSELGGWQVSAMLRPAMTGLIPFAPGPPSPLPQAPLPSAREAITVRRGPDDPPAPAPAPAPDPPATDRSDPTVPLSPPGSRAAAS